MNLKEIKELIEMLKDTDISELEIERSGVKVRLRKGGDVTFHHAVPRMEHPPTVLVAPAINDIPASAAAVEKAAEPLNTAQVKVTSPIVGTYYRSSSPDKPAYVEVGDVVKKGQVLCIIEAMKLMNEIESDAAGKIVQILVENGSPVEYGQSLYVIEAL